MANRAPGPACKAFDQRGLARVHTTHRRPSLQEPGPGRACGFAGRGLFNFHMYDNLPICTLPKLLRQARRPALVLPSPGPRAHRSRPVEDAPSFPTCATVAPTSKVEGALMQPSLALVELGEVTARAKATDSLPADGLPALHNGLPGAPPVLDPRSLALHRFGVLFLLSREAKASSASFVVRRGALPGPAVSAASLDAIFARAPACSPAPPGSAAPCTP